MGYPVTYDAFVSYNCRDTTQVELLATRLTQEAGLRLWLDRTRLQPGFSWRTEIETAMNGSAAALIVWGPSGLGPVQHQERDLAYAIRDARPDFRVLYIFLPGTPRPQGTWANVDTWIACTSNLEDPDVFAHLVATLKGETPPTPLIAELPDEPAPYRGLAAFGVEDARFFFGRTPYVEDMLERLSLHPFLAVIGPSGSGKTSLVQAGLLARLHANACPGSAAWPRLLVHPGPHPLRSLAAALLRLQPQSDPFAASDALLQRLQDDPDRLPEIIQLLLPPQGRLVLVVDRLEELFTLCQAEEERQAFLRALLALIQHPHRPAWVVATMRADFYGHVGRNADLAGQVVDHQLYLKSMAVEEVAEIIEAPAAQVGAIFEKGLAMQVQADTQVRGEVALPLLEHTLDLLWRKRRGRWLTWDAYQEVGGVTGALRYQADRVIEGLNRKEQEVARCLFLRLIWLEEGTGTMAGRRIEKAALVEQTADPEANERVLHRLADERLVVLRGDGERATTELAHDTLPLHWDRLRQWVQEDREFVLWRQRLLTALAEWEHIGRDKGALLRRARLAEAERWLAERNDDLSRAAHEFIWASRAEEKDEIERQREEAERYRQLFEEAERQRHNVLARQLAAQAELTRNQRADLLSCSVLLAVEAMRRSPSLEADQTLRHGLALLPRPIARLEHEGSVQAIALSPDGRYLATASQDYPVRVWEMTGGREVARLEHERVVTAVNIDMGVAFSPDGQYLATASGDHTARVWEATSGREVIRLTHQDLVWAVAFSPDGQYLATASQDCTARVWAVTSGHEVTRLPHEREVRVVAFSPDGQYLATASSSIARVWEATRGREVGRLLHDDLVKAVVFSPDGTYLVSASSDHTARVWEPSGYREVARITHPGKVNAAAFSPDGAYLATASTGLWFPQDSVAQLWESATGQELGCMEHEGRIFAAVFSPDGQYLATASGDYTARVWEVASSREVRRLLHDDLVWAVTFSPDGSYLATASMDGMARVWEVASGREIARLSHGRNVVAVAFSSDGRFMATASSDSTARVWETINGREVARLVHERSVKAIVFSPDDQYVATASADHHARVWAAASGREVTRLAHGGTVWTVAFSPNGRYLATASADHTTRVWLWRPEDLIAAACTRLTRNLTLEEWRQYLGDEPYRKTCTDVPR
jgi:WD40 repeat protein